MSALRAVVAAADHIASLDTDGIARRQALSAKAAARKGDWQTARDYLRVAFDNLDLYVRQDDPAVGRLYGLADQAATDAQHGGRREGAGAKPKAASLKRRRRVLHLTDAEFETLIPHMPEDVRARLLAAREEDSQVDEDS